MSVYLCLMLIGLIAGSIRKRRHKALLVETSKYYVIFFYFVCLARTLVGNGGSFLSTSFADKGTAAYVKVVVLCLCIAVGLHLADTLFKNK